MIGQPAIDVRRVQADLDALAEFRASDEPGWTRRVFSEPYVRSREWVAQTMLDAGLAVARDTAGNLIGTLPASARGPALVLGSHTDTVAQGGRFDGPLGMLGAIEVARCIGDAGRRLRHELRVIDFAGEEPNEFGISCVGSRAIAGSLTKDHLALRDPSGRTLGEAIRSIGGDPARIDDAMWSRSSVLAYVELHIEQGPILEQARVPVGIVTSIAGIERLCVTFEGAADHAGTTPMDRRRDALCAAAEAILAAESAASTLGGVATVGRIEVAPGALNVIPGRASLWIEIRHATDEGMRALRSNIEAAARDIAERRRVNPIVEQLSRTDPTPTSSKVRAAMERALGRLALRWLPLTSGAGHDSVQMARLGPIGMLFVPSAGGRSHCPEEWTEPRDVEAGVNALLATVLELDAA